MGNTRILNEAVDYALRARRRITMYPSTFDLRAVSFGWAVIDAHQNPVSFSVNQIYHNLKQYSGDCFSFSTVKGGAKSRRVEGRNKTAALSGNFCENNIFFAAV